MPGALPHVLLVEDDAALGAALKFALEAEGYSVDLLADAEPLLALPPPMGAVCVLMDQGLPGGLGIEVLERLRAAGATATMFLMTTQPAVRLVARARALQVTVLEKPILGGRLLEAIRTAGG